MSAKRFTRIMNPLSDGSTYTSHKNAARFVERGRAKWVGGDAIEFIADTAHMLVSQDLRIAQQHHSEQIEIDRESMRQRGTLMHDWRGSRAQAEARKSGDWIIRPGIAVS